MRLYLLVFIAIGHNILSESDYIFRDSQNDNKKCGEVNSSHRLFRLNGKDADKKNCEAKCAKNEDCVAFSGIWNQWCIGCDVKLTTKHQSALAFKKDYKAKYTFDKFGSDQVVVYEGNNIESKGQITLEGCKEFCDEHSGCQSFAYCAIGETCWLKDRTLYGSEKTFDSDCTTYFKSSGYKKFNKIHCFGDKYGSYRTIQSAKADCSSDGNCLGVYDIGCDAEENNIYLCKRDASPYSDSPSSCIYQKLFNVCFEWNEQSWDGVAPVNPVLTECGLPLCIPCNVGYTHKRNHHCGYDNNYYSDYIKRYSKLSLAIDGCNANFHCKCIYCLHDGHDGHGAYCYTSTSDTPKPNENRDVWLKTEAIDHFTDLCGYSCE